MSVRYFDPKEFEVIFQGASIGGFAQEFIEARFSKPLYRMIKGCDGDSARIRNGNRAGVVKVSLLQSSPSNNQLSEFLLADGLAGFINVGPLLCRDKGGGTVLLGAKAFIENIPPTTFGVTAKVRTWTFVCDNLIMYLGGLPMSGQVLSAPSSAVQTATVDRGTGEGLVGILN